MTREEAIKIFNTVLFFGKCDCPKEEIEECLKMAIKALEQEPTTKTCRTCRNFGSHHGICEICKDNRCWTEKEPQSFKWCTNCKEYDQEKHCCHRYSKVIRDAVEEIEQEPVLDKLRAEIEQDAFKDVNGSKYIFVNRINQIIDKYKAESEST